MSKIYEVKTGKFAGINFVQDSYVTEYPELEICETDRKAITRKMRPEELDARLSNTVEIEYDIAKLEKGGIVTETKKDFCFAGEPFKLFNENLKYKWVICEDENIDADITKDSPLTLTISYKSDNGEWVDLGKTVEGSVTIDSGWITRSDWSETKEESETMKSGWCAEFVDVPKIWEGLRFEFEHISYTDNGVSPFENIEIAIGTYGQINFNNKLTIRMGRESEDRYIWQILEQDERFKCCCDEALEYKNIYSDSMLEITKEKIFLLGSFNKNFNSKDRFTATPERIRDILTQLLDWSVNWEGFKEE